MLEVGESLRIIVFPESRQAEVRQRPRGFRPVPQDLGGLGVEIYPGLGVALLLQLGQLHQAHAVFHALLTGKLGADRQGGLQQLLRRIVLVR